MLQRRVEEILPIGLEEFKKQAASPEPRQNFEIRNFKIDSNATSLVIHLDSLPGYIPTLYEHLFKQKKCHRMVIVVHDLTGFNQMLKEPALAGFFSHLAVRIAHIPNAAMLTQEVYDQLISIGARDNLEPTRILRTSLNDPEFKKIGDRLEGYHKAALLRNHNVVSDFLSRAASRSAIFLNLLENVPSFCTTPDIRGLQNLFQNKPVVVLGAGPSFNHYKELIERYRDRFVLIAADTLAKYFSQTAIAPDFFCSIERVEEVQFLFEKDHDYRKSVLLSSVKVSNEVIANYQGPKAFVMASSAFNPFFNFKRVVVEHGHSCMGLALRLANILGANPVYLIGMDLSWSADGRSHFHGSPYEKSKEFEDFKNQDEKWKSESILVPGNKGNLVETSSFWAFFKSEFEQIISQSRSQFYNLSENGAKIEKAQVLSQNEFVEHCESFDSIGNVHSIIEGALDYDRSAEAQQDLQSFRGHLELFEKDLIRLEVNKERVVESIEGLMQHSKFAEAIWCNIFGSAVQCYHSSQGALRDEAFQDIWSSAVRMKNEAPGFIEAAKAFGAQAKAEELY